MIGDGEMRCVMMCDVMMCVMMCDDMRWLEGREKCGERKENR